MALIENKDFILKKRAIWYDGGRTMQQTGNLFVTKNKIMLNVVQNVDVWETAFKESGHEHEYKDAHTFNPIKNIVNSAHNVKVAGKELKKSTKDSKEFYRQRAKIGERYKEILEFSLNTFHIEDLEEKVKELCMQNEKSLILYIEQIHEIKSGFFKIGFAGIKILMKDAMQFSIATSSAKEIRTFIGK